MPTLSLADWIGAVNWTAVEKAHGWEVRRPAEAPHLIFVTMPARDRERFTVRLDCSDFPHAPSTLFVDDAGNPGIPTAWPKGQGEFHEYVKPPPSCFVCMPLTREGLAHHAEWVGAPDKDPFNAERHSPSAIFGFLFGLLNGPHYIGRGP